MLFDKVIRIGYIRQMVKDIPRIQSLSLNTMRTRYTILATMCLLAAIFRRNSLSACARIVWWVLFFESNQLSILATLFRIIASHGNVTPTRVSHDFFNLLKLPLSCEPLGTLFVTNYVQGRWNTPSNFSLLENVYNDISVAVVLSKTMALKGSLNYNGSLAAKFEGNLMMI